MQILITFLSQAAVLGPLALGIALIYRISHVINFAAGGTAIVAGQVAALVGLNYVGVLMALAIGAVVGLLSYLLAALPGQLLKGPPIAMTMATLGFGLALEAASEIVLGPKTRSMAPLIEGQMIIAGTSVSAQRILTVGIGLAAVIGIIVLFDRTMIGRTMEACAANDELTQLYGIRPRVFHLLAWTFGGLCFALSGVLQAGVASVSSGLSIQLLTLALIGGVLGGIRSLRATALGILVVAGASALAQAYISSTFLLTPIFVLLLLGLGLRPNGLFVNEMSGERV